MKCEICGGELQTLGLLGEVEHLRCRDCGIISEKKIEKRLPTEPGFYEYRWRGIHDSQDWIPVEVVRPLGMLRVIDPTTENKPLLYTYKNAEWRKREVPR